MAVKATDMVPSVPCGHCVNGHVEGLSGECTRCGGKGFNLTAAEASLVDLVKGAIAATAPVKVAVPAEMSQAEKVAARKAARQAATAAKRAAVKAAPVKPAVAAVKAAPAAPVVAAPAGGKLPRAERKARNRALWAQLNALVASGEIDRAEHAARWAARGF